MFTSKKKANRMEKFRIADTLYYYVHHSLYMLWRVCETARSINQVLLQLLKQLKQRNMVEE